MPRGGQILRSGRYHLDAAGRLHRWLPRPTVAPVALVTVRARRMRVFPTAIEICGVLDTSFDLGDALDHLVMFDPAPDPVAAELVAVAAEAFEVPAPLIDLPGVGMVPEPAPVAPAPRPKHVPPAPSAAASVKRPPKISLKDAPSSMEAAAAQWRGAR